jgi:hypothetical protein
MTDSMLKPVAQWISASRIYSVEKLAVGAHSLNDRVIAERFS